MHKPCVQKQIQSGSGQSNLAGGLGQSCEGKKSQCVGLSKRYAMPYVYCCYSPPWPISPTPKFNLAIWQSGQSKAKLQTARGTIFVSPATREAWGVAYSPRGPGQPRVLSVAKSSPASPPPFPPPARRPPGGHRAVGHPPASLPGNKRTRRRTDPRELYKIRSHKDRRNSKIGVNSRKKNTIPKKKMSVRPSRLFLRNLTFRP